MDKEIDARTKAPDDQYTNIQPESGSEARPSVNLNEGQSQTSGLDEITSGGTAAEETNRSEDETQPTAKEESNNQTMGIP